jgi:hypothetical protein
MMTRSIFDLDQIKAAGGGHGAAGGALARVQGPFQILGSPSAAAHQLQRAHHGAHLVVQEGAGRGLDPRQVWEAGISRPLRADSGSGRVAASAI